MQRLDRFSRQREFISLENQKKLLKARVLIAGCGAGSSAIQSLVRAGVGVKGSIVLADPDIVAIENLNRQDYLERDIGRNKAEALAGRIRSIDSEAQVRAVRQGVTIENVKELVENADVIVDMIDITSPDIMLALHMEAERQGRPLVTGFDIGYTVRIYVFDYRDKDTLTVREFLGLPENMRYQDLNDFHSLAIAAQFVLGALEKRFVDIEDARDYYNAFFKEHVAKLLKKLPEEMKPVIRELIRRKIDYMPQIGFAASQLGVLLSLIVSRLILKDSLRVAPDYTEINLLELIQKTTD